MSRSRWRNAPYHLMLLPALILVAIYSYGPMFGLIIAFQNYYPARGFFGSEFVGLDHFRYIFQLPDFSRALANTFLIATLKIALNQLAAIGVALLLNEVARTVVKRWVQTLIYLPHFLSWVILSGILIDVLSPSTGLVNAVLQAAGLPAVFFLGDNRWFPWVLVLSDVWKEFGWGSIVYLAAILGINPSLYEAAVIDGAGRWKRMLHITLPGMLPVMVLLATLSLGKVLNAGFDQVFNLYSPITYESGDIIDTLVYRIGLVDAQFSVGAAVGLFKSAVSLVLISVSYALAYRYANYRIF